MEIRDTDRFAGRDEELQRLSDALSSDGVQIVAYGNRGVGKSSLARQLEALAGGDKAVLSRVKRQAPQTFDFLTVFFSCDDSVQSIPRLLLRLLSDDAAFASWVPFKVVAREGSDEIGGGLNVKIFSVTAKAGKSLTETTQELETDVVSVFTNTLKNILDSKVARDGIVIIIDEFDRIKDRNGLSSLIRTLGPLGVRFALIGVSTTVQELITEHESVSRQLADGTVHVTPMSDPDIDDLFDRVEKLLEKQYVFIPEARERIRSIARGHPFYVHLVGKHALLRTAESNARDVTRSIVDDAMHEIALKGSAPTQEATYKSAIGHSYTREFILRTFASKTSDEIHTTEAYASIAKALGIELTAISVYMGHLTSEKYGSVLEKTRERYYRFRDSLFKAYAAARPWQLKAGDMEEE